MPDLRDYIKLLNSMAKKIDDSVPFSSPDTSEKRIAIAELAKAAARISEARAEIFKATGQ